MSWDEIKAPNYNDDRIFGSSFLKPGSPAYNQADQLAAIISIIGNGVDMDYTASGSGSSARKAKRYLDALGYGSVDMIKDYNISDIKRMLEAGRPVYISAYMVDDSEDDKAGHAWVIDGILKQQREKTRRVIDLVPNGSGGYRYETTTHTSLETRELLHCNFGWAGSSNGYFISGIFNSLRPEFPDDPNGGRNGGLYNIDYKLITYN